MKNTIKKQTIGVSVLSACIIMGHINGMNRDDQISTKPTPAHSGPVAHVDTYSCSDDTKLRVLSALENALQADLEKALLAQNAARLVLLNKLDALRSLRKEDSSASGFLSWCAAHFSSQSLPSVELVERIEGLREQIREFDALTSAHLTEMIKRFDQAVIKLENALFSQVEAPPVAATSAPGKLETGMNITIDEAVEIAERVIRIPEEQLKDRNLTLTDKEEADFFLRLYRGTEGSEYCTESLIRVATCLDHKTRR